MDTEIRVAVIGLDTSHSLEFTRRMQAPDCPEDQKVKGMKVVNCMRFSTPFQSEEGLDERQKQLEEWGVKVTVDFNEAVADCDAIMIEINDPSYHLEYFTKCAEFEKPIFLDKPMADNSKDGKTIYAIAKERNLKVFSASSLRFVPQLKEACNTVPAPLFAGIYGALGKAPSGSSIVWYGVHAFEMLQRTMGRGALRVFARKDPAGVVAIVEYQDERRGIVELTNDVYQYGGCLRDKEKAAPFVADTARAYSDELVAITKFFNGADAPLELEDTLEVMSMLDAAERSSKTGKVEIISRI